MKVRLEATSEASGKCHSLYINSSVGTAWLLSRTYAAIFNVLHTLYRYRVDAVEVLSYWAKKGVKYVKWLPNSQRIDPMSPRCDKFYQCMASQGMVLLSHVGEEHSVAPPPPVQVQNGLPIRTCSCLFMVHDGYVCTRNLEIPFGCGGLSTMVCT